MAYKPVAAGLDAAQMQEIRGRYERNKAEFWDQIKEIKFMHTNNEFEQFVEFRLKNGQVRIYSMALTMDGVCAAKLVDREYFGETRFHAD